MIPGLFLGGALLFGGGYLVGLEMSRSAPAVELSDNHVAQEQKLHSPDAVARPASRQQGVEPIENAPVSVSAMERLRLLTELNQRLMIKLGIPLRGNKGYTLNDDWVKAFDISPEERRKLEALVEAAVMELKQTAAKVAQVSTQADGTLTVTVPAYPSEGGAIYDRFIADFTQVMGPERTGYMRELNQLDDAMYYSRDQFGLASTIYRLDMSPGPRNYSSSGHHDPDTGVTTTVIQLDLAAFRREVPLIYEKMLAAGQLPELPRP